MNISFTRIIKAGINKKEFNFRQLQSGQGKSYHIDVTDEKGNRIMFGIYSDAAANWRITGERLPLWIHNLTEVLGNAIEDAIADPTSLEDVKQYPSA
jgi:hypothetical protein